MVTPASVSCMLFLTVRGSSNSLMQSCRTLWLGRERWHGEWIEHYSLRFFDVWSNLEDYHRESMLYFLAKERTTRPFLFHRCSVVMKDVFHWAFLPMQRTWGLSWCLPRFVTKLCFIPARRIMKNVNDWSHREFFSSFERNANNFFILFHSSKMTQNNIDSIMAPPSPGKPDPDLDHEEDVGEDDESGDSLSSSPRRCKKKRDNSTLRKAPQAPKRFKSSYICFFMAKQPEIKEELGDKATVTDISKRSAEMWWVAVQKLTRTFLSVWWQTPSHLFLDIARRNLPSDERVHWDEVAAKDKQRYLVEKASYTGPWQVPYKRAKKDPSAPKRPMSAFLYFSQGRRQQIKDKNPEMKNTEVSRLLGEQWRNASEEERRPYVDKEKGEREKYKVSIADWRKDYEKKKEEQRYLEASRLSHVFANQPPYPGHDSTDHNPHFACMPYGQGQPYSMHPPSSQHHYGHHYPPPPPPPQHFYGRWSSTYFCSITDVVFLTFSFNSSSSRTIQIPSKWEEPCNSEPKWNSSLLLINAATTPLPSTASRVRGTTRTASSYANLRLCCGPNVGASNSRVSRGVDASRRNIYRCDILWLRVIPGVMLFFALRLVPYFLSHIVYITV